MNPAWALSQAEFHPVLSATRASLAMAEANAMSTDAADDVTLSINGRLQWIGPSEKAADQTHDDHKISLNAEKNLLDFGKSRTLNAASAASLRAQARQLEYELKMKRIEILRKYCDVLLSDLAFSAQNEAISIAFIRADRLEKRSEFGQYTELEVLEAQSAYQLQLAERNAAAMQQRTARAIFAEAIGQPERLSDQFIEPDLSEIELPIPDYTVLLRQTLDSHTGLFGKRELLAASQYHEAASRMGGYPTVSGYGEIAEYSRVEGGSDEWVVGVAVKIPLAGKTRAQADTAQARAARLRVQAEIATLESSLRMEVLELWQEHRRLSALLQRSELELDARDLYLDKARALYQMNVRSDLGDAMIRFSWARHDRAEVAYKLLVLRETLKLYTGTDLALIKSE